MRIVADMSALYRLWWKILGSVLKTRSLEFEAFRQKYAQSKPLINGPETKAQEETPEATTPTTSENDHYL